MKAQRKVTGLGYRTRRERKGSTLALSQPASEFWFMSYSCSPYESSQICSEWAGLSKHGNGVPACWLEKCRARRHAGPAFPGRGAHSGPARLRWRRYSSWARLTCPRCIGPDRVTRSGDYELRPERWQQLRACGAHVRCQPMAHASKHLCGRWRYPRVDSDEPQRSEICERSESIHWKLSEAR